MLASPIVIIILNTAALSLANQLKTYCGETATIYAPVGKFQNFPHEFSKFSDFIRECYQRGDTIIAVCSSGIVIRALAPILASSLQEPPVLSAALDGSTIVPLLGVTAGANNLARHIAQCLKTNAAITTSGELCLGLNLLFPPDNLQLINRQHGKKFIARILDGEKVQLTGISHKWLEESDLPVDEAAILQIHVVNSIDGIILSPDRLIYKLCGEHLTQTNFVTTKIDNLSKNIAEKCDVGRVTIVGLGPGPKGQRTLAAEQALRHADDILGYSFYIDQAGPFRSNQNLHRSDNRQELERSAKALTLAQEGKNVALISSGDAGVFGMAAAFFEVLEQKISHGSVGAQIDIVIEPGITAALAASSRFGAPLGTDFAIISLSDNLKPQSIIEERLRLSARADMAMALYNPVSKARTQQIIRALTILREEKSPTTFIGIATDIGRIGEETHITTLQDLCLEMITSRTVLIIGSSQSRVFPHRGRQWLYTPRSYKIS